MNKFKTLTIGILCTLAMVSASAKGSFYSSGARSTGSSFSSSRPSSVSRPTYAQRPAYASGTPRQTTMVRNTIVNRTYTSHYVTRGGYYGSWGMGYHYNNGLMTGLLLGNLLHPMGTVMYAGPGMYGNNAVLYPNGMVVDQNGYQVGSYMGGQFTPVNNGQMVAQQAPQDAGAQDQQPVQQQVQQAPVDTPSAFWAGFGKVIAIIVLIAVAIALGIWFFTVII